MSSYPKFFTKEGRTLRPLNIPTVDASFSKEKSLDSISSLMEENTIYLERSIAPNENIFKKIGTRVNRLTLALPVQKYAAMGFAVSLIMITGITARASIIPRKISFTEEGGYNIYSSKPLTYEYAVSKVNAKDSRAEKIDGVFNIYKCPMEGLGGKFVEEADKYGIPWWLAASVAFKESSCGKNTPTVGGQESYNAWGWGVYGDNVRSFDNFARGIETVSKYFSDKFYSLGIEDPCEIMKVYTPPSDGSWCRDVIHFSEVFDQYRTL
ncbi:hypothetical protein A2274_02855 [candidate division WWE3 bacterium RIFOXYA12_FULL_43_11]|nr:MAG: hypothetical protein A2274_02855 [candidate division WWE3 bacterium RIFOXYA12_FULL_43_11]